MSRSAAASNRVLEAMARALYREWFVHFRFPGSRPEAGAEADGHEKLPRVASPLGDFPQGWEVKPVESLMIDHIGGGWGSHRFAITNDAGRVAGELGNSAAVVHRHYRELVKPADAERWFAVRPNTAENVVAMPSAGIN